MRLWFRLSGASVIVSFKRMVDLNVKSFCVAISDLQFCQGIFASNLGVPSEKTSS